MYPFPRFSHGIWTPVVGGSTTAGTYEALVQQAHFTRINNRVILDFWYQAAAAITGGGAGILVISGFPYAKGSNGLPAGNVAVSGVDFTGGAGLVLGFFSGASSTQLCIFENNDNAAQTTVGIAGLSANDRIFGSISYETDDRF